MKFYDPSEIKILGAGDGSLWARSSSVELFTVWGTDASNGQRYQWAINVPAECGLEAIQRCLSATFSTGSILVAGTIEARCNGKLCALVTVDDVAELRPSFVARVMAWLRAKICRR